MTAMIIAIYQWPQGIHSKISLDKIKRHIANVLLKYKQLVQEDDFKDILSSHF